MQNSRISQNRRSLLLAAGASLAAPLAAHAQAGGEDIVLGGSIPMTGVFAFAGVGINAGISDYVKILNDGGGIKGRKVRYVPEDTGYKVDVSVAAYKKITSQNKVSLYYGDSTAFSKTINPELDRNGNILMAGASFATELNDPKKYPNQFLVGPDYTEMFGILLRHIAKEKPGAKVAFVYSDSEFGRDPVESSEAQIRQMRPEYQSTAYIQGFLAAMLFTEAAKRTLDAKKELNGKNLKAALNSIKDFDTGGLIDVPITIKGNSIPVGRVYKADMKAQKMVPASDWISL